MFCADQLLGEVGLRVLQGGPHRSLERERRQFLGLFWDTRRDVAVAVPDKKVRDHVTGPLPQLLSKKAAFDEFSNIN